jgi:signal transduction histidine kinase
MMTAVGSRLLLVGAVAVVVGLVATDLVGLGLYAVLGAQRPGLIGARDGDTFAELIAAGLDVPAYVALRLALELGLLVACSASAVFILARRPPTLFTTFVAVVLVASAVASSGGVLVLGRLATGSTELTTRLGFASLAAFFVLTYLFPNGRFVPRWTRWLALTWGLLGAVTLFAPWWEARPAVATTVGFVVVAMFATGGLAQVHRYRRVSTDVERQQTKWVALGLAIRALYLVVVLLLPLVTSGGVTEDPASIVVEIILLAVSYALACAMYASFAIAIRRRGLFDVDVWISRAIVYGILVSSIAFVYLAVVVGLGLLWPGGELVLAVSTTAALALAAHPAYRRLVRLADRLVYGRRDDPYTVLGRLGDRLATTESDETLLPRLADTLVSSLGLRHAVVELRDARGVVDRRAEAGEIVDHGASTDFTLRYGAAELGRLRVWSRADAPLRDADRRLLAEIAAQVAIAVQAARTTDELRTSRELLVTAHESERRRLVRDLHDGIAPTVASVHLRVDTAIELLHRDPAESARLLAGTRVELLSMVGDIRRLVEGLRPPNLDELGLGRALAVAVGSADSGDRPRVEIQADALPPLSPDVELVAYRIAVEAVTNARRHSGARICSVRLTLASGMLTVAVLDDGVGIRDGVRPGGGLNSMRERAAEIGAGLTIERGARGGTNVVLVVPVASA